MRKLILIYDLLKFPYVKVVIYNDKSLLHTHSKYIITVTSRSLENLQLIKLFNFYNYAITNNYEIVIKPILTETILKVL